MKYALRKLIAFIFLLGILWLIYRDVDNIWDQSYMMHIFGLFVVFAAFWLLVPLLVVWARIRRRERKNRCGYAEWRAKSGDGALHPHHRNPRLNIDPEETLWFHEKGTFYVTDNPALDAVTTSGRIGDVAFPREPRVWRKAQRVHCYFTSRRILFLGKDLDCDFAFAEISAFHTTPGGIVFNLRRGELAFRVAFTFVNPLIASDILHRIMI